MSYQPGYALIVPPMVSAYTFGVGWFSEAISGTAPTSTTWESANRTVYMPLVLTSPCVIRRVWWANGATTTGGATIQVGIYRDTGNFQPGVLIISGSAVQGTASEVQFVDVTDTPIAPGLFWIAITASSTTNTMVFRSSVASTTSDAAFRFEEASAMPSTATPVETSALAIWLCGFATTASP